MWLSKRKVRATYRRWLGALTEFCNASPGNRAGLRGPLVGMRRDKALRWLG
jgi:hypothetical protein